MVHYGTSADAAAQTVADIEALGRKAIAVGADVTSTADVDRLLDETIAFLGGLDILVCNAGHLIGRVKVEEMTDEHFQQVVDVNLGATFRTTRAAIPHLAQSAEPADHHDGVAGRAQRRRPRLGGLRGGQGRHPRLHQGPGQGARPRGITVNSVAPGYIAETAFHQTFSTEQAQAAMVAGTPIGRAGAVEDVANAVRFLALPASGYLTGITIDIDGGTWPR